MGSIAAISEDSVAVDPGGEASAVVRVRNVGTVVDQFEFEGLGDAAGWTTFDPPSLSLFPDAEGEARVLFNPPRTPDVRAGDYAVGVRIRSREDPQHPTVEELNVDVGRFVDAFAELVPRTTRGRRKGSHTLAVDNRGNDRLEADLSAMDPDDRLKFAFEPPTLVVAPGSAGFAKLVVRPLKRFMRGASVAHPFEAQVNPAKDPPLAVQGTMLQEAIIPRWAPKAAMGVLVLGLAGALLWATLLKPEVKSTAKEVAQDTVQDALRDTAGQIAALAAQVAKATPPASAAPAAGPATTPVSTTTTDKQPGTPFDGRLETGAGKQTVSYTVPADKVVTLTDLVLQNPQGDSGLLSIIRGTDTLLTMRLENFRDLDYHFVSPVVFAAGSTLTLKVECANPAPATPTPTPAAACSPAAYYAGFSRAPT